MTFWGNETGNQANGFRLRGATGTRHFFWGNDHAAQCLHFLCIAAAPCDMSKFSAADTLELPVLERLQLVEDIWDTIAVTPEALPLTEEDKRLIDERLEACRRNPQAGKGAAIKGAG